MRNRWNVSIMLLTCLLVSMIGLSQTTQTRQAVNDALKGGKVSVTLEGLEHGKSLRLVVTNLGDSSLALVLPKGDLDFDLTTPTALTRTNVTVSVDHEVSIDLQGKKTFQTTVPQTGRRMRLMEGKVTLKQTPDGLQIQFENAMWGSAS